MITLTEEQIYKNYKNKIFAEKSIKYLKNNQLLPLSASSNLSSIVGHLMGDGNLSKDVFVGDFRFYGTKEKLINIEKKVFEVFKIRPKILYERKGGFVLKYNNALISRILNIIGVPRGNKVLISYKIPNWIVSDNKNIKKSFLTAIFDDELSSPKFDKKGYFQPLRLKFNKTESHLPSAINFLETIRSLLQEFNIKSNEIKINNFKYLNKFGMINRSLYFNISSTKDNLIIFRKLISNSAEKSKWGMLDIL